jgi:hypothetical protein
VSLYCDPTNSGYSSDANTYWNESMSCVDVKSNRRTLASNVGCPDRSDRSVSPSSTLSVPALPVSFGPTTLATSPVVSRTPEPNPTMLAGSDEKVPEALKAPVYTIDSGSTVTLSPTSEFTRSAAVGGPSNAMDDTVMPGVADAASGACRTAARATRPTAIRRTCMGVDPLDFRDGVAGASPERGALVNGVG